MKDKGESPPGTRAFWEVLMCQPPPTPWSQGGPFFSPQGESPLPSKKAP